MGRAMNAFLPSKAMSYPQQLPVSPVHMLEAVVCWGVPTVPTLPVPLLKCLTFHPPPLHLMTGCVWEDKEWTQSVDVHVCMCVRTVYQGMNKSQRA